MTSLLTCVFCVVTVYAGPYVGQPLYCGGIYDVTVEELWVAVPVVDLISGKTRCGDLYYLSGVDVNGRSWSHMARVGDAGPLSRFRVQQPGGCLACILGDLPAYQAPFPGLSARVERAVNFSARARSVSREVR